MKKILRSLLMLICSVAIMTSCDDKVKMIDSLDGTFKGDKLMLNYSDLPMLGKTAKMVINGAKGDITLTTNVIAGEEEFTLTNINFVGPEDSFSFEGETTIKTNAVKYSGNVKGGVCTLNLDVVYPAAPVIAKWNVNLDVPTTLDEIFLMMNWTTDPDDVKLDMKESEGQPVGSSDVTSVVLTDLINRTLYTSIFQGDGKLIIKDIELLKDGNIAATTNSGTGSAPIWVTENSSNIVTYCIEDENTLRLFINDAAIMGLMPTRNPLAGLEEDLKDILLNGIPVNYVIDSNGNITLTLESSFILPLLKKYTPLLMGLLPNIPSLPDMVTQFIPTAESLALVLEKTTDFSIRLKLNTSPVE